MTDEMAILDLDEALRRAMGDVEFLKMLMEELHRSIPDYAARISRALKNNDLQTLGSDAHQFKGAAANLGAKALADSALQLERIGKSGSVDGAAAAIERLEQSIAAFNQAFDRIDWDAMQTK